MPNNIICPYCLRKLGSNDLLKVCSVDASHVQQKRPLLFGNRNRCTEPGCNGAYVKVKCAMCGEILPPTIAQYDRYLRLAVVSPSGGGKTVYLTMLFYSIMANSRSLGLNLAPMDQATAELQQRNIDRLINQLSLANMGTNAGVINPMQWSAQDVRNSSGKSTVPTYSLTIFDGAGEDQEHGDEILRRYIAEAKMILVLLDPTKLYGVRSRMTPDEIQKAGGSSMSITPQYTRDFISSIIDYIRIYSGTPIKRKISTPVAIALGKMDMMRRFFVKDSMVFQPSGHIAQGKFDEFESQQIHSEIDAWLSDCGDDLSTMFSASFKTWRYFGLSSLGVQPDSNVKLHTKPQPMRVLDPLIWNLHLENLY